MKELKISSELSENLELGDLTIFIGRSNAGKSRILDYIHNQIMKVNNAKEPEKNALLKNSGLILEGELIFPLRIHKHNKDRPVVSKYTGFARKLMEVNNSI